MTSRPSPDTPCAKCGHAAHERPCGQPMMGVAGWAIFDCPCTEYVAPATEPPKWGAVPSDAVCECAHTFSVHGISCCRGVDAVPCMCYGFRPLRRPVAPDTAPHDHRCALCVSRDFHEGPCICVCGFICTKWPDGTQSDWKRPATEADSPALYDLLENVATPNDARREIKAAADLLYAEGYRETAQMLLSAVSRLTLPSTEPAPAESRHPRPMKNVTPGRCYDPKCPTCSTEPAVSGMPRKVLDATEDSPAVYREGSRLVAGEKYDAPAAAPPVDGAQDWEEDIEGAIDDLLYEWNAYNEKISSAVREGQKNPTNQNPRKYEDVRKALLEMILRGEKWGARALAFWEMLANNERLTAEFSRLRAENERLDGEVFAETLRATEAENGEEKLRQENAALGAEIAALKRQLAGRSE